MNYRLLNIWSTLLLLLIIHPFVSAAVWEINVNTMMTEEGKKWPHPTLDHPVYYYPYVAGYLEVGPVGAGNKRPADAPIEHALAEALASQGYFVTHANGEKLDPAPSIILGFKWGYIESVQYMVGGDSRYDPIGPGYNERAHDKEMALVGIKLSDLGDDRVRERDLVSSADDKRYFVIISAYDFAAYYSKHKTVLLWVSRMSIPKQAMDLEQVVAPLIKAGTPFLGRETGQPKLIDLPNGPDGKVELGAPVVKGYIDPASTKPLAPPPH